MNDLNCKICNAPLTISFILKEMMFGFRDEFKYYECSDCGCIQIAEFPKNIEKYYPPYYYSFTIQPPKLKRKNFFKRLVKNIRIKRKYKRSNDILRLLRPLNILPKHRILDVGCGSGDFICKMFNLGFEKVTGVDKFIKNEIDHGHEVRILKKELSELPADSFDLVMMHHVLEHMEDQQKELILCRQVLKPGGYLLVRIPIKNYAWEKYKENWVQLDPPRHFFIHTIESFRRVGLEAGFDVIEPTFDSTDFQFAGSELYIRGIPLNTNTESNNVKDIFSEKQLTEWQDKADELNHTSKGDQAIFYLRKP